MADFLQDYSNIAGAGAAFQGFAEGMDRAQDKKYKRMQQDAEIEAVKTKMQREEAQSAIEAWKNKAVYDPTTQQVSERPQTNQEMIKEESETFGRGGKFNTDEQGKPIPGSIHYDPGSLKAKEAEARITANLANQNFKRESADSRNIRSEMQANKQYSTEMGGTEKQLLNANKATSLVDQISSGKLKSTPQIRSDLSAALGSLINQGQPATVYSMSHQDFDSAYGRAQGALQFLSGNTVDSMTKPQLQQLSLDLKALQNEFSVQHSTKWNALKEGLPDQFTPKLERRFQSFRKGAGLQQEAAPQQPQGMLGSQGLVGGGMLGSSAPAAAAPHPQDSAAVQWAKQNPQDPRAAAIMKANGL